jgi:SAM-dependent methyltransferase
MGDNRDFRPEDFIKCYSPLQDADLILFLSRDSPGFKKTLRKIKNQLPHLRMPNDVEENRLSGSCRGILRFWTNPPPYMVHLMPSKPVSGVAHKFATATPREPENILRARILKQYGTIEPETIARALTDRFANDHLRKFEYAFYARCLAREDVTKQMIVDLGGGSHSFSTVVPMLFRFSGAQIISVDVDHPNGIARSGARYVRGDCRNTGLESDSVDIVSLISTLEHVGLGRYGDPLDVDGDIRCMEEARRILRPGGHLALTIPYGFPTVVFNLHRIYDESRFGIITRGFSTVHIEYSKLGQPCKKRDIEDAKAIVAIPGYYNATKRNPDAQGSVLALLRKM